MAGAGSGLWGGPGGLFIFHLDPGVRVQFSLFHKAKKLPQKVLGSPCRSEGLELFPGRFSGPHPLVQISGSPGSKQIPRAWG